MEEEHFEKFALLISGIHWNIQKIKARNAEILGLRAVHIFWVYLLMNHPEGMTASEIAAAGNTTRGLVSREIEELVELGIVTTDKTTNRRRYCWRFLLTEKGKAVAEKISEIAMGVQNKVNEGIPEEDLTVFYRVLDTLNKKFDVYTEKGEKPE